MTPHAATVGQRIEQAGESGTFLMGLSFQILVMVFSTEQEITWLSDWIFIILNQHHLVCINVRYLLLEEVLLEPLNK